MIRLRPAVSDSARVGLFLFCFFAAGAVLTAYLPLWLADRRLDAATIGAVLGFSSLARVGAVPLWGWAADRLGRHRASLFAASVAAAICAALLPLAPGVGTIAALVLLGGIASSALAPLCDAVTLALAASGRLEYGRTRAWGSIAYMVATAGAGALLGRAGTAVVPWLLAIGYGAAALLASALPRPAEASPAPRRLRPVALGRPFRAALLATALTQGSHAAYYAFASLHWRGAGLSDAAIGMLIAEGIVAEVALFVWGRRLVERLGPARLTTIAASACLLRWTLTAATVSVPWLAAIQLLHAGTFACQHLSNMLVLRSLPASRAAFAQTLLAALGFSAPTGIMIAVVGLLYHQAGGYVFLLMAVLGGSALLVVRCLPLSRVSPA